MFDAKAARRLNDRMRNLEKSGLHPKALDDYKLLLQDLGISTSRIPQRADFDFPGMTNAQANRRIKAILSQKTSSVAGVKRAYRSAMKTWKEKYGVTFKNAQQYLDFISSNEVKLFTTAFGYDELTKGMSATELTPEEVKKSISGTAESERMSIWEAFGYQNMAEYLRATS